MKSFEQMYSEFYGAEIDDAAQIQLYSHSGTELKEFVNYCIEQAGINTVLCKPASDVSEPPLTPEQIDSYYENFKEPANSREGAAVGNSAAGKGVSGGLYCGCTVPNRNTTRVNWCGTCNKMICA
jgi:hypothetical protein